MIKYLQNIGNNKILEKSTFGLNVYVTNNKSSISNLFSTQGCWTLSEWKKYFQDFATWKQHDNMQDALNNPHVQDLNSDECITW